MISVEFENYQETSQSYDETRIPVGVEILLGCFASMSCPLDQQTILDGGCGTGNYLGALQSKIGQLQGLELNWGMLEQARGKLQHVPNIELTQGNLTQLPFSDAQFDGMTCNQAIHHLDDPSPGSDAFPMLGQAIAEAYRVLKPGGVLVFNTCSRKQLEDGFWWADLIPEAMQRVAWRFPPLDTIATMFESAGFRNGGRVVPVDGILQGDRYLDPMGPLKKQYRDGDSTWALATDAELDRAMARVQKMNDEGTMGQYLEKRDRLRQHIGQTTFIYAYK